MRRGMVGFLREPQSVGVKNHSSSTFLNKKKPNQSSLCDDADIVAQLLFVPDKLDPNQTKLSEFRLSRISWRIPKSRLPGSLLSSATVQNSGGRLFLEVKLSQSAVRTAQPTNTNISAHRCQFHFISYKQTC